MGRDGEGYGGGCDARVPSGQVNRNYTVLVQSIRGNAPGLASLANAGSGGLQSISTGVSVTGAAIAHGLGLTAATGVLGLLTVADGPLPIGDVVGGVAMPTTYAGGYQLGAAFYRSQLDPIENRLGIASAVFAAGSDLLAGNTRIDQVRHGGGMLEDRIVIGEATVVNAALLVGGSVQADPTVDMALDLFGNAYGLGTIDPIGLLGIRGASVTIQSVTGTTTRIRTLQLGERR